MIKKHDLLSRKPFDLYQLHLFHLVVELGSFTQAAQITGLTQSAITRQMQSIEKQLGLSLLNRTTRSVKPTAAGCFLIRESASVLGDVDLLLRRLKEEYASAPKEVRVGVSRSVSLAYLPGFFSSNVRQETSIISRVIHTSSDDILRSLETNELDIGVLLPATRVSTRLRITHRFRDVFTFIGHADRLAQAGVDLQKNSEIKSWLEKEAWLSLQGTTQTGACLLTWLKRQKLHIKPVMELDNFDLIINLVALGIGISLVPQRALALYGRRHTLVRIPWPKRFTRNLVIVIRRQKKTPEHIERFVENILF